MNIGSMLDEETLTKLEGIKKSPDSKKRSRSTERTKSPEDLLRRKVNGAKVQIDKTATLHSEIENDLSKGLNGNKGFLDASKRIDKKRKVVIKKAIKNIDAQANPYVFDEEAKQAMLALENELTDSFAREVYNKMAFDNKQVLLDYLVDNTLNQDKSEIIFYQTARGYEGVISFSDNGYLLKVANKEDFGDSPINIDTKNALYNIVAPDGRIVAENLDYASGMAELEKEAQVYHKQLKEELIKEPETPESEALLEIQEEKEETGQSSDIENDPTDVEGEKNVSEPLLELEETSTGSNQETEPLPNTERHEYEPSPLFNKFVLSKLGGWTKENLESSLKDQAIDRQRVKAWDRKYILGIVSYSSVGYSTFLTNQKEVTGEGGVDIKSEKAIYSLVGPDGVDAYNNLRFIESQDLLWSESEKYLANLNREFEENKEEIEKELGSAAENNEQVDTNNTEPADADKGKPETTDTIEERSEALKYAETMGIKPEELEKHNEFLELNPLQQKFVLEALNRTSLAKIKVEAHNNFIAEKSQKKWWHLGYALNQNFHKKKHEILAAKGIHEKGLEGYGEAELSWLSKVVKEGPEINIDKSGNIKVDYLKNEDDDDDKRKALFSQYNYYNYYFRYKDREKVLEDVKKDILASAKDEADTVQLVSKLMAAEKQQKLNQFLKSDPETEKIIKKLADSTFGGTQFKMFMKQKWEMGQYMGVGMLARTALRSETAAYLIGKGFTYAVGPAVAACIGGYRANKRAAKTLDERAELAQLGIKDNSESAKDLNLAVGSREHEGKKINVGLSDKLEGLIYKFDSLKAQAAELEKNGRPVDSELAQNIEKVKESLRERINFTDKKIEDKSVLFGNPSERAQNYYTLLNSLEEAKTLLLTEDLKGHTTEENSNGLSVADRLASFLNYNEEKRKSAEFKYLVQQTGKGAVMGASFALIGSWVFEHTGLGDWTSTQLSKFGHFINAGKGLDALYSAMGEVKKGSHSAMESIKNAFSSTNDIENTGSAANLTPEPTVKIETPEIKVAPASEPAISKQVEIPANTDIPQTETVPQEPYKFPEYKFPYERPETPEYKIPFRAPSEETGGDIVDTETPTTPDAKIDKIIPTEKSFSDEIRNENGKTDSVWKSLREIFKNNATELGYKGDINDSHAFNRWAETQTANAIHNSDNVTDKVFEGNRVNLVQEGDHFKVVVEQGEGDIPGQLDSHSTEPTVKLENADTVKSNFFNENDSYEEYLKSNSGDTLPAKAEADPAILKQIADTAHRFHVPAEKLESMGNDVFKFHSDNGEVIFDSNKGIIKEVLIGTQHSPMPKEFIDELKGRTSLDKFIRRDGLEKIFSNWNKLTANEKIIYANLGARSDQLIKTIGDIFKVDTSKVYTDAGNKHFLFMDRNRTFDVSFDGVKKLARFLSR